MTDFEALVRPFVVQPRITPFNVVPVANKKSDNVIVEYGGGSTIAHAQGETSFTVTVYSPKYQKEKKSNFVKAGDQSAVGGGGFGGSNPFFGFGGSGGSSPFGR